MSHVTHHTPAVTRSAARTAVAEPGAMRGPSTGCEEILICDTTLPFFCDNPTYTHESSMYMT